MSEKYKVVFWGLFLTTVHINLGSIQLLPPFIALLIVYAGLGGLFSISDLNEFKTARTFCLIAAAANLSGWAAALVGPVLGRQLGEGLSSGVYIICEMGLFYFLLTGSARAFLVPDLPRSASWAGRENSTGHAGPEAAMDEKFVFYQGRAVLITVVFGIVNVGLIIGSALYLETLLWLVMLAGFIVQIWMLVLVHGLDKAWRAELPPGDPAVISEMGNRMDGEVQTAEKDPEFEER